MNRLYFSKIMLPLILLFWATPTFAHKVSIFAWVEGDTVHTESKFSGGKRVKDGTVSVLDSGGALLLEGRTDDYGAFSFKPPCRCDLAIVISAGMGHQNTWRLSAAELPGPALSPESPVPPVSVQNPQPVSGAGGSAPLTAEAVEVIVARQLDEKLQPLTRMMAQATDPGPSFSDIMGGMGYIVGWVGLGAYIRYRKEGKKPEKHRGKE